MPAITASAPCELEPTKPAAVVETTSRAANRLAVLLEGIIGHL